MCVYTYNIMHMGYRIRIINRYLYMHMHVYISCAHAGANPVEQINKKLKICACSHKTNIFVLEDAVD
jgi:hypothetical protein